jgi:hypothetical protein
MKQLNDDEKSRSLCSTVKPVSPPTLIIHEDAHVLKIQGGSLIFFQNYWQKVQAVEKHIGFTIFTFLMI